MADTKVSDLNSITVAGNNDILYIVNPTAGTSNKITFSNLVGDNITDLDSRVLEISGNVDLLVSVNAEVALLEARTNTLSSDVASLTGNIKNLNEDSSEVIDQRLPVIEGLIRPGITNSIVIGSTTLTFLSGVLQSVT
tara:strand:+ start:16 stop:429 length:414 start_codon:yes stop_codon:yes gene_type:complete